MPASSGRPELPHTKPLSCLLQRLDLDKNRPADLPNESRNLPRKLRSFHAC
ncbi:hypothetical protein D3C71_2205170 [compost metagenome]